MVWTNQDLEKIKEMFLKNEPAYKMHILKKIIFLIYRNAENSVTLVEFVEYE